MTPEEKARLARLVSRMEDHAAFVEALFERLPAFRRTGADWGDAVAKLLRRKRGDRRKLNGAALLEEVALDLAKWRRRQLRADGLHGDDAWERALGEVAAVLGLSPSTMQDWYKGKSRRKRKKRERDS